MATLTTSDGTRLYYEARGSGGPPLLFVHGWCSRLGHWRAQMRHFAKRHRVLALDRRGHGRSDVPARGYTAKRHAADLSELARRERLRPAVVVGHAGGGAGVLEFARSYPERVRAVVLVDTMIGPRARIGDPQDPAGVALGAMIDLLEGENGSASLAEIYSGFFGPHAGEIGRQALAEALETPLAVAAAELRSLAISTQTLARKLEQKVLWISVDAADQNAIGKVFRDVQFGQTVGSGHFPHLEVPEQINAMIGRFVETL